MSTYAPESIDAGWLDWVAENRLMGCSSASMVAAMGERGIPAFDALAAIAAVEAGPGFRAAERLAERLRKLESVLANEERVRSLAPSAGEVTRRHAISRDEWLRDHVAASCPLVLVGQAAKWPAMQRWQPEALAARYGDVAVEVQSGRAGDPEFELNKQRLRTEMPLGTLVERVLSGAGNDLYLTANNQALMRPGLAPLLDDVGSLPVGIDRSALPGASLLWLGGAGTFTPAHHDTVMLMHTQVVGRKHWWLCSPMSTPCLYNQRSVFSPVDLAAPDLHHYPLAAGLNVLQVVLEPGDTLFLPLGWWHQVRSLDVSVSMSFTALGLPTDFHYFHPGAASCRTA